MPIDQPSSAPDADRPQPHDADTAAEVLRDTTTDTPGGGTLGPRSAHAPTPPHGTAPNAPIDTGLPAESPQGEAPGQAVDR